MKFNLALSDYHYAIDLGGDEKIAKSRLALTHHALGVNCFNNKDYEGANIEFSRVSNETLILTSRSIT